MGYHLHWPPSEILSLPTGDRLAYVRLLNEQLEREQSSVDDARLTR